MISIKCKESGPANKQEDLAKKSIAWYKTQLAARGRTGKIGPGVLQFQYQAETVSWYDKFPLVIFLKHTPTGFSGLNLHYLPPDVREAFLDHILTPGSSKVNINNFKRDRRFKATVKNYNLSRLIGSPIMIGESDYTYVASLPSERFFGITKESVWRMKVK